MGALVEDGLQEQERATFESLQTQAAYYQQQLKDIEAAQAEAIAGVTAAAEASAEEGADALRGSYDAAFDAIRDGARDAGRSISEYLADRKAAFEFDFPEAPRHFGGGDYTPVMPDVYAASGFHGMVHRPTVFMAGEAGSERVDITPKGQMSAASSLTPDQIAVGVAMGLRMVGLDSLGTNIGMTDALDRVMPGYVPGMLARNPGDVRTKTQSALGVR